MYIKVWCEYDMSGQFGANNDQEVLKVSDELSVSEIDALVLDYVMRNTDCSEEELEGLFDWEPIAMEELE